MDEPIRTARCACGWEITGPESEVAAAVAEHGLLVHNMTSTLEEILAGFRASGDSAEASGRPAASVTDAGVARAER